MGELQPITERFWKGQQGAGQSGVDGFDFSTPFARANHDAVEAASSIGYRRLRDEAFERQGEHVPCFPVNLPSEVADNAQYKARGFFVEHDHPAARTVRMPGAPCMFSRTPWQLRSGAPRLGEHNGMISEIGRGRSATGNRRRESADDPSASRIRVADFAGSFRSARDRVAGRSEPT